MPLFPREGSSLPFGVMDMKSIHTFKQQNPHINLNVILVVKPGETESKYMYVLNFSHMSVIGGFEGVEQIHAPEC
jgi:hypothetical protein